MRAVLPDHEVVTAYELGWSQFKNGELIEAAEADGFQVFVTTNANIKNANRTWPSGESPSWCWLPQAGPAYDSFFHK